VELFNTRHGGIIDLHEHQAASQQPGNIAAVSAADLRRWPVASKGWARSRCVFISAADWKGVSASGPGSVRTWFARFYGVAWLTPLHLVSGLFYPATEAAQLILRSNIGSAADRPRCDHERCLYNRTVNSPVSCLGTSRHKLQVVRIIRRCR